MPLPPEDLIPDVRDGLTRVERIILHTLHQLEREQDGRPVPTAMLYGYVVEHVNLRPDEFQALLARLVGRGAPGAALRPTSPRARRR